MRRISVLPGLPVPVPVVAAVAVAACLAGCGGQVAVHPAAGAARPAARVATTATTSGRATTTPARPPAKPKPKPPAPQPLPPASLGHLPQTNALPSSTTPMFSAEMDALWSGIVHDEVRLAMPAFFPEPAYAQVKAIADPAGDWQARLVGGYTADVGAAHALLGAGAATARLLRVIVPSGYAHWVPPGVCYNGIGYWETPNSRVVYSEGGQIRSFGIASMISWRGVWFVVHLGAVVPTTAGGTVDDPSAGEGYAAPSSTC